MEELTEAEAEELGTVYGCATIVAECLMATNSNDYDACLAIVDQWEPLKIDGPRFFIGSVYEMLSAIHEGQKMGTRRNSER